MQRLRLFFRWLYTLDHYWRCERLTLWDFIYKKRIGIKRAWYISGEIKKIFDESK